MALPPNDVASSELFLKLSSEIRPSEVVDFPRRTSKGLTIGRLRIQVLNMDEHDSARLDAERWLLQVKKLPKSELGNPAAQEVLGDRIAREVLAQACVSVEPIQGSEDTVTGIKYNRIFPSPDALGLLRPDELNTLFVMYKMVQRKFGPYEGNLENEDQVTAWEKKLVEGASALPLGRLDWHQSAELITSLAERSYTLSAILASQSSNLPNTLVAALRSWGIGITSRGVLPLSATKIGLSVNDLGIDPKETTQAEGIVPLLPDEPLSMSEATRLALQLASAQDSEA